MPSATLLAQVVDVIRPFARNDEALENAQRETTLLEDLRVNSARLIDVILAIEDRFGFSIEEDEEEGLVALGDLIDLIEAKGAS